MTYLSDNFHSDVLHRSIFLHISAGHIRPVIDMLSVSEAHKTFQQYDK